MYSKFQFFPLPPCNPQAMSEIPCPSSSPSPVTVTELCLLSWGLSCHLWGHHKPLARLLSQVWSSLVTPAEFPPSGIGQDPPLCPWQEEISPFRGSVTPQFSPWSLPWWHHGAHGQEPSLVLLPAENIQCHLHPGGAEHCLLWKPSLFTPAFCLWKLIKC